MNKQNESADCRNGGIRMSADAHSNSVAGYWINRTKAAAVTNPCIAKAYFF